MVTNYWAEDQYFWKALKVDPVGSQFGESLHQGPNVRDWKSINGKRWKNWPPKLRIFRFIFLAFLLLDLCLFWCWFLISSLVSMSGLRHKYILYYNTPINLGQPHTVPWNPRLDQPLFPLVSHRPGGGRLYNYYLWLLSMILWYPQQFILGELMLDSRVPICFD